jgi:hypothetical protein
VPAGVAIGPAREHDGKAWRKAFTQARKGALYLLGRGPYSFELWWEVERACSHFITPLKAGLAYEHVRWLSPKRQRERVKDHLCASPGWTRGATS